VKIISARRVGAAEQAAPAPGPTHDTAP